jgi:hypothetical protein
LVFVRRTRHQFIAREFSTDGGSTRTRGTVGPFGS